MNDLRVLRMDCREHPYEAVASKIHMFLGVATNQVPKGPRQRPFRGLVAQQSELERGVRAMLEEVGHFRDSRWRDVDVDVLVNGHSDVTPSALVGQRLHNGFRLVGSGGCDADINTFIRVMKSISAPFLRHGFSGTIVTAVKDSHDAEAGPFAPSHVVAMYVRPTAHVA